jgi:hypothetical protein
LVTTRSPTANPVTPRPTSSTRPTWQYANANGWSSLLRTASSVATSPSVRTFSSTIRTLSGWLRALASGPASPNSTSIRSVPAEISECDAATNTCPGLHTGRGTSASSTVPFAKDCKICFIATPQTAFRMNV